MRALSVDYTPVEAAALDPLPAVAFIEQEAGVLRDALARPDDPVALLIALHHQERAHESWLTLVGAAQRDGHDGLADRMAALYAFHGRVAGCLERSFDHRLDPVVERRLRMLLLDQLQGITGRAVERLVTSSGGRLHLTA